MHLVVDANILFSEMIKPSKTRELLFHWSLTLSTPCYIHEEITKYHDFLKRKTKLNDNQLHELIELIFSEIDEIYTDIYEQYKTRALELLSDNKDWPYLALSLAIVNDGIWSNDKGFLEQNSVQVYSTTKLIEIINSLEEEFYQID
ncbi:MAG: PIN domain-containing protein [Candidatus Kariarchaeaceae archaeon]